MPGLFGSFPQVGGLGAQQSPGGLFGGVDQFRQQNPGALTALGAGLMNGSLAEGFAAAAPVIALGKQRNMTAKLLLDKGIAATPEEAATLAANPALINAFFKGQDAFAERAAAARQYGLDPASEAGRAFILTGDLMQPGGGSDEYFIRQSVADRFGLKPDDPAYKSFVLTGRMPREDQGPLTAVDKKAILDADDMVAANENAISALEKAETLSDKANSGWFADTRAAAGNNLPDWMVPDFVSSPDSSQATTDMDNAVVGQALASLKTIFGGNPTEGERKILLDLQGSSSMPAAVRKSVFTRAKELAQRRLAFNKQRANELRGGEYYKQGGMSPQGDAASEPATGGGDAGFKILSVE